MTITKTGKRKVATLLMNLDATTTSELLKGFPPDDIQQLVLEMAQIESSGSRDKKMEEKVVQEFCRSLQKKQTQGFNIRSFLGEMLGKLLDKQKAEELQSQVRNVLEEGDPFEAFRSAETDELLLALESESPTVVALILSELKPKKARDILSLFDREVCCKVVWNMTKPAQLRNSVKHRIASVINERLNRFKGRTVVKKPKETLRNLAIMLSDTEKDLRIQALEEISSHNEETATMVKNLMVTWEDILTIADRSLQEALRTVESKQLAMALYQADEEIAQRIRSNISERANSAVEEEKMLMQEPSEDEIFDAREEVVGPLRKANEDGSLRRVKGK